MKQRLKKYNISAEHFVRLVREQRNRCAICGQLSTNKSLAVDHKHDGTGMVRGLLCQKCNCGIGMFNDSTELLLNAIAYLNKSLIN